MGNREWEMGLNAVLFPVSYFLFSISRFLFSIYYFVFGNGKQEIDLNAV
jgi:hypothetical protein